MHLEMFRFSSLLIPWKKDVIDVIAEPSCEFIQLQKILTAIK